MGGRDRFPTDTTQDFRRDSETFARYRLPSLAAIRQTDREARRAFLTDLRDLYRRSFPERQLPFRRLSHFSAQLGKRRPNAKDPPYEAIALPEKLRTYAADLSPLEAFLRPNLMMGNFISRELARGKQKVTSYAPYIVPDLTDSSWPVPTAEHTAANLRRRPHRQSEKAPMNLQLPSHGWGIYRSRLICTDDVCGAWLIFGGLADQLNHLSAALHLPKTESVAKALLIDQLLSSHLGELARSRDELVAGAP